eukprot:5228196-Prymnesium_polylepis.1
MLAALSAAAPPVSAASYCSSPAPAASITPRSSCSKTASADTHETLRTQWPMAYDAPCGGS